MSKKKWWILISALVLILFAGGGYYLYRIKYSAVKPSVKEAKVGQLNPLSPTFDVIHGKTLKATAAKGGAISVYDTDKVGMIVSIPAGAVDKDTTLKVIPIKRANDGLSGVAIFPDNIKFNKPVSLSFNFSFSAFKNDKAPDNAMGAESILSGSSHIYYYNTVSTSFMPQLVARNAESKKTISAEISGSGIYSYILNDQNELARANYALNVKDQTIGTTLEAAAVLAKNNKKFEDNQRDLLSNAISRVKSDKTPNPTQLNSALSIERALKNYKSTYLITHAKADVYSGYLETICKDPSVSIDQILSAWKTAQQLGHEQASENCKTRVQNIVSERVNKLLDQPDPTYVDLLKAQQDAELVGLGDKFDDPLNKKRHDKAVREAQELLKDPSVDPRILAIALQNLQLFVDDKPDLEQALKDRMNQGLDTDVQRVLNDPNASKQDIQRALAKNDFTGGNPEIKKQLEDKLKDAKEGAEPKVDTTAKEQVEEEIPAFDWAVIGTVFLQMMGVEDFSEAGLKSWADEQAQQFEELRAYTSELCAFVAAMGGAVDCASKDAEMERAIQQFKDGIADEAEKVGQIQALPEEQVDNDYDGNNEETLSVSCISNEEARDIDPEGKLGYTICEDNEPDQPADDRSGDQAVEEDNTVQDSSDQSSQEESDSSSDAPLDSYDTGTETGDEE